MRRPSQTNRPDGFATVDLLIVVVIILIVVSYAWTAMIQLKSWQARSGAAQQFAHYLEMARSDSMRRRATEGPQMAQVTILNDSYYEVRLDANGDGVLDAPRVVSLAEQQLMINGPFPRTFMFDSTGKAVDASRNALGATAVTFGNRSGKSAVTVSDTGKATFVELSAKK